MNIIEIMDMPGTEPFHDVIRRAVDQTLLEEGIQRVCEVSVTFVNDEEIQALNCETRGIDRVTDVLSFPVNDAVLESGTFEINPENGAALLGDIVLSFPRALAQAMEYGHTPEREIGFLTVHSMLHLLGYDHVNDEKGERYMLARQESVLGALGLKREVAK